MQMFKVNATKVPGVKSRKKGQGTKRQVPPQLFRGITPKMMSCRQPYYMIFDTRLRQDGHKILPDHGNAAIFSGKMHS